jgi:methyl-accepting chemotaxis protein
MMNMTQNDDLSPAVRLAALEVTQHEHELLLASHGELIDAHNRAVLQIEEVRRKTKSVSISTNQNRVDLEDVQGEVFHQGEKLRELTALVDELTEQVEALKVRGAA